jgi:hypothetical protein
LISFESSDPKLFIDINNDFVFIYFMTKSLRGAQSSGAQNSVNPLLPAQLHSPPPIHPFSHPFFTFSSPLPLSIRKNTSTAHSPDSQAHHPPNQVRRRSSSLSSSLEEFRVGGDPNRRPSEKSEESGKEKQAQEESAEEEEEEEQQPQSADQHKEEAEAAEPVFPSSSSSSLHFVDPTAPLVGGRVHTSSNRTRQSASFVVRKPSPSSAAVDGSGSGTDFLLSLPEENLQRLKTPPMPPVKDPAESGGAVKNGRLRGSMDGKVLEGREQM